jgi:hypothetical protein
MSQEDWRPPHWWAGLAMLLSLLALGALGLVACDDDETTTAETEVITSDFGQDPPGTRPSRRSGRSRSL